MLTCADWFTLILFVRDISRGKRDKEYLLHKNQHQDVDFTMHKYTMDQNERGSGGDLGVKLPIVESYVWK